MSIKKSLVIVLCALCVLLTACDDHIWNSAVNKTQDTLQDMDTDKIVDGLGNLPDLSQGLAALSEATDEVFGDISGCASYGLIGYEQCPDNPYVQGENR